MNTTISDHTSQNLFGVYEMDAAGTVFYHKAIAGNRADESVPSLIGHNFFDEIGVFQNVKEFQQRFKYFVNNSHPADGFNFDFQLPEKVLGIRVRLVRVRETQDDQTSNLIIVDIRKLQSEIEGGRH